MLGGRVNRLRPLVAATIALAAGIVFALGAAPPPSLPLLLLCALAALLAGTRIPRAPILPAAFTAVGMLLGQATGEAARSDCRAYLPEGIPLEVSGALVAHPSIEGVARL